MVLSHPKTGGYCIPSSSSRHHDDGFCQLCFFGLSLAFSVPPRKAEGVSLLGFYEHPLGRESLDDMYQVHAGKGLEVWNKLVVWFEVESWFHYLLTKTNGEYHRPNSRSGRHQHTQR